MKKIFKQGLAFVMSLTILISSISVISGMVVFASGMEQSDYFTEKPTEVSEFKIDEYSSVTDFENDFKAKTNIIQPVEPEETKIEFVQSVNSLTANAVKIYNVKKNNGTSAAMHGVVEFKNPDGNYKVKSATGKFYLTAQNSFWSRVSGNYLILGYKNASNNQKLYSGIGVAISYSETVGTKIYGRYPYSGWYYSEETGRFIEYNSATGTAMANEIDFIKNQNNAELTEFFATYQYTDSDLLVEYEVNWEYSSAKEAWVPKVTYKFNVGGKSFSQTITCKTTFNEPVFGYLSSNNTSNAMYVSNTSVTYDIDSYRTGAAEKFNNYFANRSDKGTAAYENDYATAFNTVKSYDTKLASLIESTSLINEFNELVESVGAYTYNKKEQLGNWIAKYNAASSDIKTTIQEQLSGKLTGMLSAYDALKNGATFFDDFENNLNWQVDHKLTGSAYSNWRETTSSDFSYTKVADKSAMFTQCKSGEKIAADSFYYTKSGNSYTYVENPVEAEIANYYKSKISYIKCSATSTFSNQNLYYTKSGNTYTYVENPEQANISGYYVYAGTKYFKLNGENYELVTSPSVDDYDKYYTVGGNYKYIYYKTYVGDNMQSAELNTADPLSNKVLAPNTANLSEYCTYVGKYTNYCDNLTETNTYSKDAAKPAGDSDGNAFWGINEDPENSKNNSLWLRKSFNAKNTTSTGGDTMDTSVWVKPSVMYTTKDGVLNPDQYIAEYSGKLHFNNVYNDWDRYKYSIGVVYSYTSETQWKAIGLNGGSGSVNINRTGETSGSTASVDSSTSIESEGNFYRGQWLDFSLKYNFDKGHYVLVLKGYGVQSGTTNEKGDLITRTVNLKGATELSKKVGLVSTGGCISSFDDISVTCVDANFVSEKINALPELDNITLDDEDLVYSINTIYNYLPEADKTSVSNRADLIAAVQRIADLKQARDNKLDLTDYSTITFEDGEYTVVTNPSNSLIDSYYEQSEYSKTNDISVKSGKNYYVIKNKAFVKVSSPNTANIASYYEKTPGYVKTFDETVTDGKVYYELQKGEEYLNLENGVNRKAHSIVENPYKNSLNSSDNVIKITTNSKTSTNFAVYNIKPEALNNNGMIGYYTGKTYIYSGNRYNNTPIVVYDYQDQDNWKGFAIYMHEGNYGFHCVDVTNGKYTGIYNGLCIAFARNDFNTSEPYSVSELEAGWVEWYIQYSLTAITLNATIVTKSGNMEVFQEYDGYTLQETCATGVGIAAFNSTSGVYFDDLKVGMYETDEFTAAKSFINKNSYVTESFPYSLYMSQTDATEIATYKSEYQKLKDNNPKAINYLKQVPYISESLDKALDWAKTNGYSEVTADRDEEMLNKAKEATDSVATGNVTYYTESGGNYKKVQNPDRNSLLSYYVKGTEYVKTSDTSIQTGKEYYTLSGGVYTKVDTPNASKLHTYYEAKTVYKPAAYSNYKFEDDFLNGFSLWRDDERNKGTATVVEDPSFAELTKDTKVVAGKQYYTKAENVFSQKTTDTSVVKGKGYYTIKDEEFVYVENPKDSEIANYYDSPYKRVENPKDEELSTYYENVEVLSLSSYTSITPKSKFLPEKAHLQKLSYKVRVMSKPEWYSSLRIYNSWVSSDSYAGISFSYIENSINVNTLTVWNGKQAFKKAEEFNVMDVLTVEIEYDSTGKYVETITDQHGHEIHLNGTANLKAILKICSFGKTAHYSDVVAYYDYGLYDDDLENSNITTYYTGNTYTNPGDIALVYGDSIGSTVSSVQAIQLTNTDSSTPGYIDRQAFDFEGVQKGEFNLDPTEVNNLDYWTNNGINWDDVSEIKIQQKVKDSIKFIMPETFTDGIYAVKLNGMNIAENPNDFKIVYFNVPYIDYSVGMDGETSAPNQEVKIVGKNIAPNTSYKIEEDYTSYIDNGVKVKLLKVQYKKTEDTAIDLNKTYFTLDMSYEELDTVNKMVISSYYEKNGNEYTKTSDTAIVKGKTYYKGTKSYTAVEDPVVENIGTYYERVTSGDFIDAKITNIYSSYALGFEVPDEIKVPNDGTAVEYEVYVYNGYGDNTAWGVPYVTKFAKDLRSTWSQLTVNVKDYMPETGYSNGYNPATAAFVNALNVLANNGGGILRIPKGTYRITQSLIIPENVQIIGDSKEDTELIFSPYQWDYNEMPKGLFRFNDNVSFKNLFITGSRASGIFAGITKSSDNIYIENINLWFAPDAGPASDAPHDLTALGDTDVLLATESCSPVFSVTSAGDNINIIGLDGMDDHIDHRPLVNDLWGSKYYRLENNELHEGWSEVCANYGWVFGNTFQNACIGIWGHGTYLQDNHLCDTTSNNRELYVADRSANYSGKIVPYSDDPDNITFKFTNSKLNSYLYDDSQLYIRSGQGEGQTRRILSVDPDTGWFTVDRPFSIAPNRNSAVIVRRTRENIFFVNNYFENGAAGGFYGGVADVVYDGNIHDRQVNFYMQANFNDVNWYYSMVNETYVYHPMNANHVGRPAIETGYSWSSMSGYNGSMCGTFRNNELNGATFSTDVQNQPVSYAMHDIIIDNNRFNDITESTGAITGGSDQDNAEYRDGFIEYRNTFNNVTATHGGKLVSQGILENAKKSTNDVGSKRWIHLESEEQEYFSKLPYGDVDGDSKVTLKDAILIRNYLIGINSLNEDQLLRADVNGDGDVTLMDANEIKYKVVGLITEFEVEKD